MLAECVGLKHDIATLPVLRSVPEILETQRVRSWRLKEWEPRNIPRRMCRPEASYSNSSGSQVRARSWKLKERDPGDSKSEFHATFLATLLAIFLAIFLATFLATCLARLLTTHSTPHNTKSNPTKKCREFTYT